MILDTAPSTITDTGFVPVLPRLAPNMERAILLREVKLQRERDAKAAAVEWCWRMSQLLTLEAMADSRQLREYRQLRHMRGRRT